MPVFEVNFLVSQFPNNICNFDSFRVELEAADPPLFAAYLGGCEEVGATDPTDVFLFNRAVTPAELITLTGVVAAHQGDPLYASANSATVAVLAQTPGSVPGAEMFATDGRKVGEGIGAGTGVPVYWDPSSTSWLVFSDDTQVQA